MPRSQLLLYLGLFAAMVALYAWNIRQYLRRRRLKRQLVTDGRLPQKPQKRRDQRWLLTAVVAVAGVMLVWLVERAATRFGLAPFWAYVLTGAVLFVFIFTF